MKTIYWLDCQAYCACRKVEARPLENEDGTLTDRWVCTVCGCEFVRRAAVRKAKMEVGEAGAEWDIVLHSSVGIVEMRTPPGADRWEVYGLDGCKVTGVRVTRIEEAP